MTCPICLNKAPNCDCSKEAKELYELQERGVEYTLEDIVRRERIAFIEGFEFGIHSTGASRRDNYPDADQCFAEYIKHRRGES